MATGCHHKFDFRRASRKSAIRSRSFDILLQTGNRLIGCEAPWAATVALGVDSLSDREPYRSSFDYTTSLHDDYSRISYLRYTQRF